jgi:hypothetical protein
MKHGIFIFSKNYNNFSQNYLFPFFVNNCFPPKSANVCKVVVGNHHFHQVHKLGKWKWVD